MEQKKQTKNIYFNRIDLVVVDLVCATGFMRHKAKTRFEARPKVAMSNGTTYD